jgi:hypothetical protein
MYCFASSWNASCLNEVQRSSKLLLRSVATRDFSDTDRSRVPSSPVTCCWPSPAQPFLVSGPMTIFLFFPDFFEIVASSSVRGSDYYWSLPHYWGVTLTHLLFHFLNLPDPTIHHVNGKASQWPICLDCRKTA